MGSRLSLVIIDGIIQTSLVIIIFDSFILNGIIQMNLVFTILYTFIIHEWSLMVTLDVRTPHYTYRTPLSLKNDFPFINNFLITFRLSYQNQLQTTTSVYHSSCTHLLIHQWLWPCIHLWMYPSIHPWIDQAFPVQNTFCMFCMHLHALACADMPLHALACFCMLLHAPACACMPLHALACACMLLHTLACPYMPLHALTCSCTPFTCLACSCIRLHALVCYCMRLHASVCSACSCVILHALHAFNHGDTA